MRCAVFAGGLAPLLSTAQSDPILVGKGETFYADYCWTCHGQTPSAVGVPSLMSAAAFAAPSRTDPSQSLGAISYASLRVGPTSIHRLRHRRPIRELTDDAIDVAGVRVWDVDDDRQPDRPHASSTT